MDFFKITTSQEDFNDSEFDTLILTLIHLKDTKKIIEFTKQNFFDNVFFYFLVDDIDKRIKIIEDVFMKNKVKQFGRKEIMRDIEK